MEIENLLNQNKELLNTFDKNNDGIIDHTEINFAVQKAKVFSKSVLKNKSVKEWFYYGQKTSRSNYLERRLPNSIINTRMFSYQMSTLSG